MRLAGAAAAGARSRREARRSLFIGTTILIALGLLLSSSILELVGYLIIVGTSLIPAAVWIRRGGKGVPVLAVVALPHVLYFALPVIRNRTDLAEYSLHEILIAASTVSLFLMSATLGEALVSRWWAGRPGAGRELIGAERANLVVFAGLSIGLAFHAAAVTGGLRWLGSGLGLMRSVASTGLIIGCYFLGVSRARGNLKGISWALALALLGSAVLVSVSSLFLIGGATYALGAGLGYVITKRRIPWAAVIAGLALLTVLHAGKERMRDRYWLPGMNFGGLTSLAQIPGLLVEWFESGVSALESGEEAKIAIDRASLLQVLLRAQRLTPMIVEYLHGETYLLAPRMLVPRFLAREKLKSQAGMDLLNIRYGYLSVEGAESTAINWGLIAEAWANFGFYGQVGVGLLLGLFCGALTRWSSGASAVSLPTLVSVASMLVIVNGSDFSSLVTSLAQTLVAVAILLGVLRFFPRYGDRLRQRRSRAAGPRGTRRWGQELSRNP